MGFARKILLSGVIAGFFLSSSVVTTVNAAPKIEKLVIYQDAPVFLQNDKIAQIGELGSVLYFEGKLRDLSGKEIGRVSGHITVTDVSPYSAKNKSRYRELVFQLPGGQIIALGAANYDKKMITRFEDGNAPVTIAIVGGTGKYRSAKGEVVTTKPGFGIYRHAITLDR